LVGYASQEEEERRKTTKSVSQPRARVLKGMFASVFVDCQVVSINLHSSSSHFQPVCLQIGKSSSLG